MIELKLLGTTDISGLVSDPEALGSVVRQPKRLALLAYLAAAEPAGTHQRDALLALLWPEHNVERGRHALRQSLHVLRRALGTEVILSRGDGGLAIDPTLLGCDASCCRQAIAVGDRARALELYRGPLLSGLHVNDAPAFERWLDVARAKLSLGVLRAAMELAAQCLEQGDVAMATSWARRAAEIEPDDERALQLLVEALDRTGDRAGAVRAYDEFARRLALEMEVDPSPESARLIAAVRARQEARVAIPPYSPSVIAPTPLARASLISGATDASPLALEIATPHRSPSRRSRGVRWIMGASVAMAIAGSYVIRRPPGTAANGDGTPLLITRFENPSGNDSLNRAVNIARSWINGELSRSGLIEVTDGDAVGAASGLHGPGREDWTATVARSGATMVLTGSLYTARDSVEFRLQLTNARNGRVLSAATPVRVALPVTPLGLDVVRRRVLGLLAQHVDRFTHYEQPQTVPPPSLEAYTAFLEGERVFNEGRYAEAITLYTSAASEDPAYLPPRLRIADALENTDRYAEADTVLRSLEPRRGEMPIADALMLDELAADVRGNKAARLEAVRRLVSVYPREPANRYQLAWELADQARFVEARAQLLQLDSAARADVDNGVTNVAYWTVRAGVLHWLGQYEDQLQVIRAGRERFPRARRLVMQEIRALSALGQVAAVDERIRLAANLPPDYLASRRRIVTGPWFLLTAAQELTAHGHPADGARHALALVRALDSARAVSGRDEDPLLNMEALNTVGRYADARRLIARSTPDPRDVFAFMANDGAAAAAMGDMRGAAAIADTLSARTTPYTRGVPTLARARIAAASGATDEAARLLRQALAEGLAFTPSLHVEPDFAKLRATRVYATLIGWPSR